MYYVLSCVGDKVKLEINESGFFKPMDKGRVCIVPLPYHSGIEVDRLEVYNNKEVVYSRIINSTEYYLFSTDKEVLHKLGLEYINGQIDESTTRIQKLTKLRDTLCVNRQENT